MNCAMSGMHILHAIFVLLTKIIPMNVKMVIYVFSGNDFRASAMEDGGYYTRHKNLSIFTSTQENPKKRSPNFEHSMKFIMDFWGLCKIHGIRCLFVGRTCAANDNRAFTQDKAKALCKSLRYDYIDLGECVKNKAETNGQDLSTPEKYNEFMEGLTYDKTHLTARGSAIVGEAFADELFSMLFEKKTGESK